MLHALDKAPIQVIRESEGVEVHLQSYQAIIGDDYEGYKGHIYRVLSYALHYLSMDQVNRYRSIIEVHLHCSFACLCP